MWLYLGVHSNTCVRGVYLASISVGAKMELAPLISAPSLHYSLIYELQTKQETREHMLANLHWFYKNNN